MKPTRSVAKPAAKVALPTATDFLIGTLPHKSPAERGRMRSNADRLLVKGTATQKSDAHRMLAAMDALTLTEQQTLHDTLSTMTVADRVTAAFRTLPPTETEQTVILALLNNPAATSTTLTAACGWKGQIWHRHFGTMCKRREADLWPADPAQTRDANFYSGILADLDPVGNRFTMKPDVALAFATLGLQPA